MTAPTPNADRRPSHDLLMQAQEKLGEARDVERDAGNLGAWMVCNDLALSIFRIAIDTEFDDLANRAYAARYPDAAA
jgi:hypothetical protein